MARPRPDGQGPSAGSTRLVEVHLLGAVTGHERRRRQAPARLGALALGIAILIAVVLGDVMHGPARRAVTHRFPPVAGPAARAPDSDPVRCLGVSCLPPGMALAWPVNARAERAPVVFGDSDR